MIKQQYKKLKPIPAKDLPEEGRVALKPQYRAAKKLRAEHKRLGMPLISWEKGKVVEIQP